EGGVGEVVGEWGVEDEKSKKGSVRNGEPQRRAFVGDGDLIELGHTFFLFRDALPTPGEDPPDMDAASLRPGSPGLETLVPALGQTFRRLEQVAKSDLSVVLSGESGTGKE